MLHTYRLYLVLKLTSSCQASQISAKKTNVKVVKSLIYEVSSAMEVDCRDLPKSLHKSFLSSKCSKTSYEDEEKITRKG